ncbi:hypothetical protein E1265_09600 [Streptomyces sp. 8K308]|uniref:hypothetical protein n=1 Tax=Streptomyces sp. 8K308 TaxID=2530388 RepID=UPI0010468A88|nr:hypothetical protein [Streptomyces sp. 8K308]TDC24482.1 hypothetical protein E1265_09600 [Streptomyces sp. 8K308]
MMAPSDHRHAPRAMPGTIQQRVRDQAAFIATAVFTAFLPAVLAILTITSAWNGWVNVMALHTYLDQPGVLPGVTWAVPVAVQAFIIAGEATMVLNSILRRRWIMASGIAATTLGYTTEAAAHIHYGQAPDQIITMIVAAVACGGGWGLMAGLMHRGVEIADGPATEHEVPVTPTTPDSRAEYPDQPRSAAVHADQGDTTDIPDSGSGSAPTDAPIGAASASTPGTHAVDAPASPVKTGPTDRRRRRSRAELLEEVRALDPDHVALSPNYVADRVRVSWANAKSLLNETGRLAASEPRRTSSRRASAPRTSTRSTTGPTAR